MKKLLALFTLCAALAAPAAVVNFTLTNFCSKPLATNTVIQLWYTNQPVVSGTWLVLGQPVRISAPLGIVTTNLEPGTYAMNVPGQSWTKQLTFIVPSGTNTYNLTELATNAAVVTATSPFVSQLLAGNGIYLSPTNGKGVVTVSTTAINGIFGNVLVISNATQKLTITNASGSPGVFSIDYGSTNVLQITSQAPADNTAQVNIVGQAGQGMHLTKGGTARLMNGGSSELSLFSDDTVLLSAAGRAIVIDPLTGRITATNATFYGDGSGLTNLTGVSGQTNWAWADITNAAASVATQIAATNVLAFTNCYSVDSTNSVTVSGTGTAADQNYGFDAEYLLEGGVGNVTAVHFTNGIWHVWMEIEGLTNLYYSVELWSNNVSISADWYNAGWNEGYAFSAQPHLPFFDDWYTGTVPRVTHAEIYSTRTTNILATCDLHGTHTNLTARYSQTSLEPRAVRRFKPPILAYYLGTGSSIPHGILNVSNTINYAKSAGLWPAYNWMDIDDGWGTDFFTVNTNYYPAGLTNLGVFLHTNGFNYLLHLVGERIYASGQLVMNTNWYPAQADLAVAVGADGVLYDRYLSMGNSNDLRVLHGNAISYIRGAFYAAGRDCLIYGAMGTFDPWHLDVFDAAHAGDDNLGLGILNWTKKVMPYTGYGHWFGFGTTTLTGSNTNLFRTLLSIKAMAPGAILLSQTNFIANALVILTNRNFIAIHQDRLGIPGGPVWTNGSQGEVWARSIDGGTAVAFVNTNSAAAESFAFPLASLGIPTTEQVTMYSAWHFTNGPATTTFNVTVTNSDTELYVIKRTSAKDW